MLRLLLFLDYRLVGLWGWRWGGQGGGGATGCAG